MARYILSTESEKSTTKITVPARISFKIDGEIKSFSDKQKLREFSTTKPALHQMLKGLIWSRNTTEEKDLQNHIQTIKKMAIGTYMSVIILNINGLKAPTKDTDWLNGYKNKIHIYAVYKKPTSDLKTHIG